ncbi:protein CHROMOSOME TRANSMISSION FIDELITY 7 [Arachis stenosperma]|uniref:protein CHROMOSOME TRANSMISSION FIDELITY 7 n=1 Tax=Arachis stenosperma TaxID=217475 RepID=UPI0025ACE18E|nr:protein CHROMOSOME TRANSMISSION FIDELITY 7 [Arachis stenosperma]
MQSKISAFFKSSSSSSASASASASVSHPKPLPHDNDDPLTTWENTKHHVFITYTKKTRPNPKTASSSSSPSTATAITGTTVVKNKKRSYAQVHLDFGQSDFLLRTCSTCGFNFTPGDLDGEKSHNDFHKCYTQGIPFRGWSNERVLMMPTLKTDRIVLVLDTDPPAHRNKVEDVVRMMEIELGTGWILHQICKVYLFISQHRIVGCLVAEPIKEAFKVISSFTGHSDIGKKRETKSTTLQFGSIVFQREVKKRAVSANNSDVMELGGAIFCEDKAVAGVCGIRAVWVTPSNRRKHIAVHMLDAVRKSFCAGSALERTQLAFSQPTSSGKALASSYTGTGSFLVYKADKTVVDREKGTQQTTHTLITD